MAGAQATKQRLEKREGRAIARRGLVAGAAALVAGIVATRVAEPVAAGVDGDVVLGASNTEANPTIITNAAAPSTSGYSTSDGFVANGATIGVRGYCGNTGLGVSGRTFTGTGTNGIALGNPNDTGGYGMFAGNYNSSGTGLWAYGNDNIASTGVLAQAGFYGVYSKATYYGVWGNGTAVGVVGEVTNNANTGTGVIGQGGLHGVYGFSATNGGAGVYGETYNNAAAVYGQSTTGNGAGVYGYVPGAGTAVTGYSTAGIGVYGVTNASNQYGVLGITSAPNSTAIAGIANQAGSSAFSGGTTNAAAYAGVFQGNVVIQGKLVVSDPSYKSGALLHPDGSHRLVYCVESAESWIEDVGKGAVSGGKGDVKLDADFVAVTHTEDYHVFLTEYGETNGLYVSNQTPNGFTVQERGKGTTSATFSWRVMAKPKSTVKSERLAKFTMPTLKLADTQNTPKPIEPPKKPDLSAAPKLPDPPAKPS